MTSTAAEGFVATNTHVPTKKTIVKTGDPLVTGPLGGVAGVALAFMLLAGLKLRRRREA